MKTKRKKTITLIMILGLLILSTGLLTAQSIGDVNQDEGVTIVDALLIAQYYVQLQPNPFDSIAADVNCDSEINIVDALLIAQLYVGLIAELPCSYVTPEPGATPFPEEQLINWGLGSPLQEYFNNNRDYSWYIDQLTTGPYGFENCGPSSVTMALKWADPDFSKTAEDARASYHPDGGWWYTNNISDYLNLYNTPNGIISIQNNPDIMINQLKAGNIMILCLTMEEIRYNNQPQQHTNSFYTGVTGHFIVIKGFIRVNNKLYFEAYDPYSMGRYYPAPENNWIKGKDRYYLWEDLYQAINSWWRYAIVVENKAQSREIYFQKMMDGSSLNTYLDPADIPHNKGG